MRVEIYTGGLIVKRKRWLELDRAGRRFLLFKSASSSINSGSARFSEKPFEVWAVAGGRVVSQLPAEPTADEQPSPPSQPSPPLQPSPPSPPLAPSARIAFTIQWPQCRRTVYVTTRAMHEQLARFVAGTETEEDIASLPGLSTLSPTSTSEPSSSSTGVSVLPASETPERARQTEEKKKKTFFLAEAITSLFDTASKEEAEEAHQMALEEEFGDDAGVHSERARKRLDESSESEGKDKSFVTEMVEDLLALSECYKALGYRLASSGYLSITAGTKVGISLAFEPLPKEALEAAEETAMKASSVVQKLVLGMLKRVNGLRQDVERKSMRISRVSVSLAGIGFGIPSATAELFIGDPMKLGGVEEDDQEDEKKEKEEEGKKSRFKGFFSGCVSSVKNFVLHPFSATVEPLISTLVGEARSLRKYLADAGLDVGSDDAWLRLKIGTYFGIRLSFAPLKEYSPDDPLPEKLSALQRLILGAVSNGYKLALSATNNTMDVASVAVSVSGIGLAIPSVTTSVTLATADAEALQAALRAKEAELEQGDKEAQEHEKELEAIAEEKAHRQGKNAAQFVLEEESENITHKMSRFTKYTINALYATGEAASKVLSATAASIESAVSEFAFKPMKNLLDDLLVTKAITEITPLELAKSWLTISYGTQFGASIAFVEKSGESLLDSGLATIEDATASDTSSEEKPSLARKALFKGLRFVGGTVENVASLREGCAHVDGVYISASGLGLGIPAATTTVSIGYKDACDEDEAEAARQSKTQDAGESS